MYQKKNKVPFPDIVSGESDWKIFEDADRPRTSNQSKEMYVPLDDDCASCGHFHSRNIRRHELGHVKWSPKTIGRLGPDESEITIEACEEVRIGYLLCRKELFMDDWILCPEDLEKKHYEMIYNNSEFEIILYLMSQMWPISNEKSAFNRWTPDSREFILFKEIWKEVKDSKELTRYRVSQINWAIKKAESFYNRIVKNGRSYYYAENPSYAKVRKVAKDLHKLMDKFNDKPTKEQVYESERLAAEQRAKNSMSHGDKKKSDEESEDSDFKPQTLEEAMLESRQKEEQIQQQYPADMNYAVDLQANNGEWCDMVTHKPELTINMQSKLKKGREYRPMDYGTNPKYINRWCVDKKVFQQKQRVYGGTILIDASGSMAFDGQDILDIMLLLPAVKIAMYNQNYYDSYQSGSLRIIADKGKRVQQEYLDKHTGGGNGVDGPALRWLGTQKSKRIWVSDMYVFGKAGSNSGNLFKECQEILRVNNITRLADIDDVKAFALQINQLN